MDLGLRGRTALITGASKGIGLGCAASLAAEGCSVVLAARDEAMLERAAVELSASVVGSVSIYPVDLSQTAAVIEMIDRFAEADVLVNNAGAIPGGSIEEVNEDEWRKGWELKVFGYITATRAMLVHMYQRRSGVIINIIGTGGVISAYEYVAGAAGNASLMSFSRAVGSRSVDHGVRVVGVNPGAVRTQRYDDLLLAAESSARDSGDGWAHRLGGDLPFGRPASANEIGDIVTFLASDRASYVSGTVVDVDAGSIYRS